jgi:hypothetical protein
MCTGISWSMRAIEHGKYVPIWNTEDKEILKFSLKSCLHCRMPLTDVRAVLVISRVR